MHLSLRDAVGRFQREPGSWGNAYDWFRRDAQRTGHVHFGNHRQLVGGATTEVPVRKISNKWVVDVDVFEAALAEHRAARDELQYITDEYELHHLLTDPGGQLRTTFGGYRVGKEFHVYWNSSVRPWDGYTEWWVCNGCWKSAHLEHNKEECHTCEDWGGCGRDCTLSAIFCPDCGTRQEI